jgi:hypothetical protein
MIALALCQPAAAAPVTYTFTGAIDSGQDEFGLFVAPNVSLAGFIFTATFTRDDAATLPENIFQGPFNSYVAGSEAFQPVTATLKINDQTFNVTGDSGEQNQYDDGAFEGFGFLASGLGATLTLGGNTVGTFAPTLGDVLAGPDYHTLTSLNFAQLPGFSAFGQFEFLSAAQPGKRTFANFNVDSLTVSGGPVAGAPEPAAWALMITGFAGAGAALRRRRSAIA